ncbi:MAG: DEAD/DEAH box helicase [Opitutales bacterium]|nr:DEAD/DEAH box helicase [Opitutales bacterium]
MIEKSFGELGLSHELQRAVQKLGFETPSSIQALTIPVAYEGQDILGISETGSGKTAAFGIPALESIDLSDRRPQVLILCPTRELSVQVCEEVHRLGSELKGLSAIPVYGGAPISRQIRSLKDGVHLVVGTPGRLLDLYQKKVLKTGAIRMVVLDEADRMLDMGFKDDMNTILGSLPEDRQSLFFSATMNREVEKLIHRFANQPKEIRVKKKELTVSTIDQCYYEVRSRSKVEVLSRLLDIEPTRLAVVFCNTKVMVDECCEALLARGYSADRIHGDIPQNIRERTIKLFREGKVELLVATDVAARGLDIDDIDVVFNYDIPHDPEDYVHRVGRTGRAGRFGRAVSFVFGREIHRLEAIGRYTKHAIKRAKIPTVEELQGLRENKLFENLKLRLEENRFERYGNLFDRLLDQGHTPTDIANGLFTMLKEAEAKENQEIREDTEPSSPKPHYRDGKKGHFRRKGGGPPGRRGSKGGFRRSNYKGKRSGGPKGKGQRREN